MPSAEGFKNVVTGLAALAVPITVAFLANYYASSLKDKDVGVKFVELAITILSKEPKPSDENIRQWATKILEKYSDVPLGTEASKDIIKSVPLPQIRDNLIPEGSRSTTGNRAITRIIVRDTQQDNLNMEIAGLQNMKVAYHYLIAKDGVTHRLADENSIAFHSSGHNQDSIGIGLMHISGTPYERAQIETLAQLLTDICRRRSISKANVVSASDLDRSRKSDFASIRAEVTASIP